METIWKVFTCFVALFFLELCNGLPLDLDRSYGDGHSQFLTGLLAILLTVCAVVCLAGCLCCRPRNGFKDEKKEFRDSPVVISLASNLDHGHVNPIGNGGEFTIFTPLSPTPSQNNIFSAREEIISRVSENYKVGDIDVSDWYGTNEVDFPRAKLKYIRELGKGWFGKVVEGTALGINSEDTTWNPVVVRILEATASNRERVLFLHDAAIYRCPPHPNILQILGRCLENVPLLLLQEYYPQGDLKSYLRTQQICKETFLTGNLPLVWCRQMASALHHLHKHNLIHPDLATRNCRLSEDLTLKLGDYGCGTTDYPEDYYNGSENVPVRWCAPECVICTSTTIQSKKVTSVGNVWSLGICFWEICECGAQPYSNLSDDEVISQVFGPKNLRLQKPTVYADHVDYIYRLMQMCWSVAESRPTCSQIISMLDNLDAKLYRNEDFDIRWDQLKPNAIVRSVELVEPENDFTNITVLNMNLGHGSESNKLSASMHNLAGSLDNLIEPSKSLDSWLDGVGDDISFAKGLSAAIHDLDNAIALENLSSSDTSPKLNKLHFELGVNRMSSGSETEDENWKRKIETGAYTEKVRQKSRSVADLMVLTHIDCSESDSETPLPSLNYKSGRFQLENVNLSFGSEGNLLNVHSTFEEELKKLQEERRDSLLFVPDKSGSQNLACSSLFDSPAKKLIEDLNSSSSIKPQNQVFNVYNVVTISPKYSPIHSTNLNHIINYSEHMLPDVVLNAMPTKIPKLSQIIENNLELMGYIAENFDKNEYKAEKWNYPNLTEKGLKNKNYIENSSDYEMYDSIIKCDNFLNNQAERINQNIIEAKNHFILATNKTDLDVGDTNYLNTEILKVANYEMKKLLDTVGNLNLKNNIDFIHKDREQEILGTNVELDENAKAYVQTEQETKEIELVGSREIENTCDNNVQESVNCFEDKNACSGLNQIVIQKVPEIASIKIKDFEISKDNLSKHLLCNMDMYAPSLKISDVEDINNVEEKGKELSNKLDVTENILESAFKTCTVKSPRKRINIVIDKINNENQNTEECKSIKDMNKDDGLENVNRIDIIDNTESVLGCEDDKSEAGQINNEIEETNIILDNCEVNIKEGIFENDKVDRLMDAVIHSNKDLGEIKGSNKILDIEDDFELDTFEEGLENEKFENEEELIKYDEETDERKVTLASNDIAKHESDNIANISKIPDKADLEIVENQISSRKQIACQNSVKISCQNKLLVQNPSDYQKIENQLDENDESFNQSIDQANNLIPDLNNSPIQEHLKSKFQSVDLLDLDNLSDVILNNSSVKEENEINITEDINCLSDQKQNASIESIPSLLYTPKSLMVKTQNFINNEILNYEGVTSFKVDFDLSEGQEEIAPNSLTHSVFTSIPYVKQHPTSVIIGASDDFSINYYNGIKTTTDAENSVFVKKGLDMKYSLETWDNFLGKSFDEQHDRFVTEPQSLLFLDDPIPEPGNESKCSDNCEVKYVDVEDVQLVLDEKRENCSISALINEEYSPLNATYTLEGDNEMEEINAMNNTFSKDVDLNDINLEMEEGAACEGEEEKNYYNQASWESETSGGWFLHPQSNDCLSGEMDLPQEESYVGFSMDDEVMAAIRNELLTKLPQAQRATNDLLLDDESGEFETSDRNEVFIKYNLYNTPLSPIPEESYSELLHSDQSTPHCTINTDLGDSDSDWSIPEMGKNSFIDDDTHSPRILESPHKGPQCRHTPSQESCCSNDTLFNLEELQYTEKTSENLDNFAIDKFSEENKFIECDRTFENDNCIVPKEPVLGLETKILSPIDSSINEYDSIPSCTDNTTIQIIEEFKNEITDEVDITKANMPKDEIVKATDFVLKDKPSDESSSSSETYLTVNNSTQNVAPLNSPEDRPWKYVEASLTECLENKEQKNKYSQFVENHLYENIEDKMNVKNVIVCTDNIYDCVESPEHIPSNNYKVFDIKCDYVNELVLNDTVHNYINEIDEVGYVNEMANLKREDEDEEDAVYESVYSEPAYDEVQDRMPEFCGPLADIRFTGPGDSQMMSTSFSDSADLGDEQDWDSGSDTRSSSSGEFIWKEGEHEASVKALHAAPQDELHKCEDIKSEEYSSSGSEEDDDGLEFVPSAWNKYATPTKSALRSPEKTMEKERKGVSFKKQKYHCVYEYPKEPDSPLVQNYDLCANSKYREDWNINTDLFMPGTSADTEILTDTTIPSQNLYETSKVPDFIGSSLLEDDFYISSSAKPFDMFGGNCQFFPGKQPCDWEELIKHNDNVTPDSGVEDITPSLSDSDYVKPCRNILPLKTLAQLSLNKSSGKTEIGGLRHTRNSLKLDLPPSPSAFTKCFAVDPIDPIITRQIPTFTTFGKSRFVVQHVDTPTDEDCTKNVSFEALPYKPHLLKDHNAVESVRGEASLLDSADEDSGIESCTLDRKIVS